MLIHLNVFVLGMFYSFCFIFSIFHLFIVCLDSFIYLFSHFFFNIFFCVFIYLVCNYSCIYVFI